MAVRKCNVCGNPVEEGKECKYCRAAARMGIPLADRPSGQVSASVSSAAALELVLLGAFWHNKYLLQKALDRGFSPAMFDSPLARKLASALLSVYESSREDAWDPLVLTGKLKAAGVMDNAMEKLVAALSETPLPSVESLFSYLDLLKNQYAVKTIRLLGREMEGFSRRPSAYNREEIERFTAYAVEKLRSLQKMSVNKRISLVREEMEGIYRDFEYREKHGPRDILGFTITPFDTLNQTLSGLRKGFLYGLAGAPRRGKTNLVLDIATYAARNNKVPVLFFTWEQTRRNLTYRLLSKECYINPDTLQRKQVLGDPVQRAKLEAGLKRMAEYQDYLYIIESTKDDTVDRVRAHAYNVMQEFNTEDIMIFVDYIQKMPATSQSITSEKFKVEEISTALKGLSIELNCPIFAISSLSKEGCAIDQADNESRPTLYHCKGSGDIEYDLDVGLVLAKDWPDTAELTEQLRAKAEALGKDPERIPKVDIVNLYIDKNRDAPEGVLSTVQFFFFVEENKFIEIGYKIDTDVYRFRRIETLVNNLIQRDFIKFYDRTQRKGRKADEFALDDTGSTSQGRPRKRIKLKI